MTYGTGNVALASDYMTFRGANDTNTAYPSDSAASAAIAAMVGVGYGSRGYGQIGLSIPAAQIGKKILASDWDKLYVAIGNVNVHTGSLLGLGPTPTSGNLIAADSSPSLPAILADLDGNRLNAASTEMTTALAGISGKTGGWSGADIYHGFTISFPSEDQARFFFNSGGQIELTALRTGSPSYPLDSAITAMLSQMGTIRFGATGTTQTGTGGTTYSVGFYNLTGTYQPIFSTVGVGTFSYLTYTVSASTSGALHENGGNGDAISFKADFSLSGNVVATSTGTIQSNVYTYTSTGVVQVNPPAYTRTNSLGSY